MYSKFIKTIVLTVLTAVSCLAIPQVNADKISDERLEKQKRYLQQREHERAEKKKQKDIEKHNKKVRKQNCDKAKSRQNKYKTSTALYKYDKSGKKVYLDKAERKKAEKQAAADVKKWCK
jgi:hypothetical protein